MYLLETATQTMFFKHTVLIEEKRVKKNTHCVLPGFSDTSAPEFWSVLVITTIKHLNSHLDAQSCPDLQKD